jgi:hypothetical protein
LGFPASYPYTLGIDDLQVVGQHLRAAEEILLLRTETVDFIAAAGVPEPIAIWKKNQVGMHKACQRGHANYKLRLEDLTEFQRWHFTRLFPGWSFLVCGGRRARIYMLWQSVYHQDSSYNNLQLPYAVRTTAEDGKPLLVERWGPYRDEDVINIWPHRAAGYQQTVNFPLLQARLTSLLEEPAAAVAMVPIDHPSVKEEDRWFSKDFTLYLVRRVDSWGRPLWVPASPARAWEGPIFTQPWRGLPPLPPRPRHLKDAYKFDPAIPLPGQLRLTKTVEAFGSYYWCQKRLLEEVPMAVMALPYGVAALLPRLPLNMVRLGLMTGIIRVRSWAFLHDERALRSAINTAQRTATSVMTCAHWRLNGGLSEQERLWRARILGVLLEAAGDPGEYYRQCFRHRGDHPVGITAAQRTAYWTTTLAEGVDTWPHDNTAITRSLFDAARGHLQMTKCEEAIGTTEAAARTGAELLRNTWRAFCAGEVSKTEAVAAVGCMGFKLTQRAKKPLFSPEDEAMEKAVDRVRRTAAKKGGLTRVQQKRIETSSLGIQAQ